MSAEPLAGLADSGMISEDLTDLLVAVGEAARSCDSGLLLAIDELQYLTKVDMAAVVGSTHRTVQLGLPVVVAGAGLPQVPALLGEARTYAERLFEFPEIGSLSDSDSAAAVVLPAAELGVEIRGRGSGQDRQGVRKLPLLPPGMGLPRVERGAGLADRRGRRPGGNALVSWTSWVGTSSGFAMTGSPPRKVSTCEPWPS